MKNKKVTYKPNHKPRKLKERFRPGDIVLWNPSKLVGMVDWIGEKWNRSFVSFSSPGLPDLPGLEDGMLLEIDSPEYQDLKIIARMENYPQAEYLKMVNDWNGKSMTPRLI